MICYEICHNARLEVVTKSDTQRIDVARGHLFYRTAVGEVIVKVHAGVRVPEPIDAQREAVERATVHIETVEIDRVISNQHLPGAPAFAVAVPGADAKRILVRRDAIKRA